MSEISVIIPCYNCSDFIVQTLNSLKEQEFDEFEVICINDGSTDNTLKILENYKFNKLKIINSENKGASNARNLGLENANSKFVFFLDSDDLLPKNALKSLYESAKKYDSDLVVGNFSYLYSDNSKKFQNNTFKNDGAIDYDEFFRDYFLLKDDFFVCIWAKLYKKEIIEKNNLLFLNEIFIAEDLNFNAKFILNSKKISKTNDEVYIYRVGENNSSSVLNIKKFKDVKIACDDLKNYFKEKANNDNIKFLSCHLIKTRFFAPLYLLNKDNEFYDEVFDLTFDDLRKVADEPGFCMLSKKSKIVFYIAKFCPSKKIFLIILDFIKKIFYRSK